MKNKRPEIFAYHDYVKFLKDWFAYLKASQSDFSLRGLAKKCGLASGYIPMVLSGKRKLSHDALTKLSPHLKLTEREAKFFQHLVKLGTSDAHDIRTQALDEMTKFAQFQKRSSAESETYEYLSHWYFVAIREMATLREFKADPEWIQAQLSYSVPLADIRNAIEFLKKSGILKFNTKGEVIPPTKSLDCSGGIYRIALSSFHKELLELAARSIEQTSSDQRNIQGHSCKLNQKNFDKAQAIVEDALRKIKELGQNENDGDSVYHMEVALFPLARLKGTNK